MDLIALLATLVPLGLLEGLVNDIERLFAEYGYPVIFFVVMGESAGLPLPGETMLLAGAVEAQRGVLYLPWVIVLAASAAIIGDNFGYLVGRRGGRPLLVRYGRFLRVRGHHIELLDRYFARHGPKTVFFGRFVIFLRVWAALFAGAGHMPWRSFLFYNALGGICWATLMGTLAYVFARSISTLTEVYGIAAWVGAIVVGVLVVLFIWREEKKRLEKLEAELLGNGAVSTGEAEPGAEPGAEPRESAQ